FCLLTLIYHKQSLKHLLQYPTGFLLNPESSSINKGKTYFQAHSGLFHTSTSATC
ncbi:hypothetical protein L873DRAFT_1800924, partial [Choiromyces venosus 120613-1]